MQPEKSLKLRRWHSEPNSVEFNSDVRLLLQGWTDEQVARFNPVPPQPSSALAQSWLIEEPTRWQQHEAFDFVIELDQTNAHKSTGFTSGCAQGEPTRYLAVGEVGFSNIDLAKKRATVGFWVLREARGNKVAQNALQQALEAAKHNWGICQVLAQTTAQNTASKAVLAKTGFQQLHIPNNTPTQSEYWLYQNLG